MRALGRLRSSGASRGIWNLVDQVVSSGNNFAIQIIVARSVSADDFGAFAIAFAVFSVTIGLLRTISTSPLAIRFSGADDAEFRRGGSAAVGTVLLSSIAICAVLVAASFLFGGSIRSCLLALGLILPGLMTQDAWRQTLFARLRPAAATVQDVLWGVLQLAAALLLLVNHVPTPAPFVLAWGGSALLAACVGVWQTGFWPRVTATMSWIREQFSLIKYMTPEYVIMHASTHLTTVLVSVVIGVAAAGSLRGGALLTAPSTMIAAGLVSFAIPEMSRRRARMTEKGWLTAATALSVPLAVFGIVWGSLFLLLPDAFGHALLRDSWEGTKSVLVPTIVGQIGANLAVGPAAVMYATERAKTTIRLHTLLGVGMATFPWSLALVWGLPGAAWGLGAAFWLVVPWWLVTLRRTAREEADMHLSAQDTVVIPGLSSVAWTDDATTVLPRIDRHDKP
jgi:O-antigen/teichoic acid export membrane protein